MLIEPEVSNISVVLLGSFNPAIFTPDWFARHGLLSASEAEAADVQIIHRQICQFRADWLTLQVEPEKFQAHLSQGPFIRVRDLVVRTFSEFLSHTPIAQLGINKQVHFRLANQKERDRIGVALAPPSAWGEWAPLLTKGGPEKRGGMISLTMQQGDVEGRPNGYIRATVEPSAKIKDRAGVYVQVNDHYQVSDTSDVAGCEEVINLLSTQFDESLRRSDWIIDQVMRLKNA